MTQTTQATHEHGSLSAFLAVLAVGLLVLVGLVVDGGRALVAKRRAVDVAQQAARVGADQLSVDALRAGRFSVDPAQALATIDRYLSAAGARGSASFTGDTVTVHVAGAASTAVLGMVGIKEISVTATAVATDVHGVTAADR